MAQTHVQEKTVTDSKTQAGGVLKPLPGDQIKPIKYRKRPVVIDAIRWSGRNLREVIDFTGLHPSAEKWTWDEYVAVVAKDGLKIFTLEGHHMASVGDWIIKGVKGEFYPCKPDIFMETYEVAERATAAALIAADAQDAERYRWLRDYATVGQWEHFNDLRLIATTKMDAQVDAARGEGDAKA